MKELIKKIQKEVGVIEDGDMGPITIKAIAKKLGVLDEPVLLSTNKLIDIALGEHALNIRETSTNQGPGIKKYWEATYYPLGYENREPWCCSFVVWCIQQAGIYSDGKRPKTPSVFAMENWAWNNNIPLTKPVKSVKKGQLVIFAFSHIAIALSDSDNDGDFLTIEGNTNPSGSREGNGVYKKVRNLNLVRSAITLQ
jgi:hypothetical protein